MENYQLTPQEIIQKDLELKKGVDSKKFDKISDSILTRYGNKIITYHQPGMCWDLSEQQEEIVKTRYLMTYKCGKKDQDIKDVCLRMQRSLTSQLTLYTQHIELIKKFENLLNYVFINRLLILNTPQIFNLGNSLEKEYFEKTLDEMNYKDYKYIYDNVNRKDFTTQACFILDVEDSVEGIFNNLRDQAMIQKQAGGVGFNIGRLRPKHAYIKSTDSESSGSLSFLDIYNTTGKKIKQGNKRRWQGMQVLSDVYDKFWEKDCSFHPDTLEFINQKKKNSGEDTLENFNISLGILNSKDLYDKFANNKNVLYTFEGKPMSEVIHPNLYDEKNSSISQKTLLNTIQENAHKSGDPGLILFDNVNKYNQLRDVIPMIQTNPCQERPGSSSQKYNIVDTCCLGHIDLTKLLQKKDDQWKLDVTMLYALSVFSAYVLDILHDMMMYPIDPVKKGVLGLRSIGLGFYGLQGVLLMMGVPYDSDEQREIQEFIMGVEEIGQSVMSFDIQEQTYPFLFQESADSSIATQNIWEKEEFNLLSNSNYIEFNNYYDILNNYNDLIEVFKEIKFKYQDNQKRRNINLTTIQPTGTTSIIGQTSLMGDVGSGIEPFYSLMYKRFIVNQTDGSKSEQLYVTRLIRQLINKSYIEHIRKTSDFNTFLNKTVINNFDSHLEKLLNEKNEESVNKNPIYEQLYKWVESHFTSMEIHYIDHLKIQEQVQRSCSSQISKTINMKNDQKVKDVLEQYLYALQSDVIKGITVYRDGSLQYQVLESSNTKKVELPDKLSFLKFDIDVDYKTGRIKPREKPIIMETLKKTIVYKNDKTPLKFHIEVGFTDNNEPFEVFVRTTEESMDYTIVQNLYGRLVSVQFRSGLDINDVLKQCKKIKNWRNEYEKCLIFITEQVEELISIYKKGTKQKKQLMDEINEQQSDEFKKQSLEPGCSVCGE